MANTSFDFWTNLFYWATLLCNGTKLKKWTANKKS